MYFQSSYVIPATPKMSSILWRTIFRGDSVSSLNAYHKSKPSMLKLDGFPPAAVTSVGSQSLMCNNCLLTLPGRTNFGDHIKPAPLTPPRQRQIDLYFARLFFQVAESCTRLQRIIFFFFLVVHLPRECFSCPSVANSKRRLGWNRPVARHYPWRTRLCCPSTCPSCEAPRPRGQPTRPACSAYLKRTRWQRTDESSPGKRSSYEPANRLRS